MAELSILVGAIGCGLLLLGTGCGQSVCLDHPADYPGCVTFDVMPKLLSRLILNHIEFRIGDPLLTGVLRTSEEPTIVLSQNSMTGPISVPLSDGLEARQSIRDGTVDLFELTVDGAQLADFASGLATITVGREDRVAQREVSIRKFAFPSYRTVTVGDSLSSFQWGGLLQTRNGVRVGLMSLISTMGKKTSVQEYAFPVPLQASSSLSLTQQGNVEIMSEYCATTALANFIAVFCSNTFSVYPGQLNIYDATRLDSTLQTKDALDMWDGQGVVLAGDARGSRLLLLQEHMPQAFDVSATNLTPVMIEGLAFQQPRTVVATAVGDLDGDAQADTVILREAEVGRLQVLMGRDKNRLAADPAVADYVWRQLPAEWQAQPRKVQSMVIAGIDGNGRNRLLLAGQQTGQGLPLCMVRIPAVLPIDQPTKEDVMCLTLPLPDVSPKLDRVTLSTADVDADGNLDLMVAFTAPANSGVIGSLYLYLNKEL